LIKYVTQNASEQKQEEATNIETNYRNTRKTSTGAVQQKTNNSRTELKRIIEGVNRHIDQKLP